MDTGIVFINSHADIGGCHNSALPACFDLFAENGSVHIDCLCKWGVSTYTERRRVLPSGRPQEIVEIKPQGDPTWEAEYQHFLQLCQYPQNNIANDIWIDSVLKELGRQSLP